MFPNWITLFAFCVVLLAACATHTDVQTGNSDRMHTGKLRSDEKITFIATQDVEETREVLCKDLGGGHFRMIGRGPDGRFHTADDLDVGTTQLILDGVPHNPCSDGDSPTIHGILRSDGVVVLTDRDGNRYIGKWISAR